VPEIAEVQTVKKVLRERVLGKRIRNVNILYKGIIDNDIEYFKDILIGKYFDNIDSIGKWLIFSIGDHYLCSHLRMEGKYFVKNHDEVIDKHEHVIFEFDDGIDLRYHDVRKFGKMHIVSKDKLYEYEPIKKQGIEPIDSKLTKEYIYNKLSTKKVPMKSLLLDQTIISGLGNIYADEVLYASGINPLKLGIDITMEECEKIRISSNKIISKSIEYGGTTIRSYTSSLGVIGHYQDYLCVHKKEGDKCMKCNTIIKRIKVGGRSTYYCPTCQKL